MWFITKDPSAVLDFGFDWTAEGWLATGETITASTWSVPTGLTVASTPFSTTQTVVWLSGGTAGTDYVITNHIVTSQGRTDERSMTIWVRNR